MQWLNYHHLYYFWMVAREGTITAACEKLRLAQPTVSAQLRTLEKALGRKLFQQVGRTLEMTETGRVVYRYANDIFSLGQEMMDTIEGRPTGSRMRLRVGIADVLPKMVVARVLLPVLRAEQPAHLLCYEGKPSELLAKLSVHDLDLVLSDSPIGPDVNVRAFNHLIGECEIAVFAPRRLAKKYSRTFPHSLDGAPMCVPSDNTSLRRTLDYWFTNEKIHPQIVAEFEDTALMKSFARDCDALFPASSVIADQIEHSYGARVVGHISSVRERYYAISLERKVRHPAVVTILDTAHTELFPEL